MCFGEVVNYFYFDEGKVKLNGKYYIVLIGYGCFDVFNVKSMFDGVYVLVFFEVRWGDKIEVNGKIYMVFGFYYYLMGKLIVLMMEKGENFYVFMRCNDMKVLVEFLMSYVRVCYFMVYENGYIFYMDELGNVKNFVMSFFYFFFGIVFFIEVFVMVVYLRGSMREVGIFKVFGFLDFFIFMFFVGDYLIVVFFGYVIGIVFGIFLGSCLSFFGVFILLRLNYVYFFKFDVLIIMVIVLMVFLFYFYVLWIRIIEVLCFVFKRLFFFKFLVVFFVVFLVLSFVYFVLVGVEKFVSFNVFFNVWVIGILEKMVKFFGEKVGYLSG